SKDRGLIRIKGNQERGDRRSHRSNVRTGRQRMLTRGPSFRFPLLLSAVADVHEWYDDAAGCFYIDGRVRNRLLGDIFGFRGTFVSELKNLDANGVPEPYRPAQEEARW
ncbi:MAG: DUF4166 domain-containing protein, partial [Verrucomicrobiota bacterium]